MAQWMEKEGKRYVLSFYDDFSGEKLDGSKWVRCPQEYRQDVGGKWHDGMTCLDGAGHLVLSAAIDIFEAYNIEEKGINHAIHWDGYGEHHRMVTKAVIRPDVYDGQFHTFGLLWTEEAYIFYIDGEETYRIGAGDPDYPGCSTSPSYMKISLEFGRWAGAYDAARLPDGILVDYVKAYRPG